jgi:hypothetical protein
LSVSVKHRALSTIRIPAEVHWHWAVLILRAADPGYFPSCLDGHPVRGRLWHPHEAHRWILLLISKHRFLHRGSYGP